MKEILKVLKERYTLNSIIQLIDLEATEEKPDGTVIIMTDSRIAVIADLMQLIDVLTEYICFDPNNSYFDAGRLILRNVSFKRNETNQASMETSEHLEVS